MKKKLRWLLLCGSVLSAGLVTAVVYVDTKAVEEEVVELEHQQRKANLEQRKANLEELKAVAFEQNARLQDLAVQLRRLNQTTLAMNSEQSTLAMQLQHGLQLQLRREYGEVRLQIIQKEVQLAALQGHSPEEQEALQKGIALLRVYEQKYEEELDEIMEETTILAVNLVERDVLAEEYADLKARVNVYEDEIFRREVEIHQIELGAEVPRQEI